MIDGQQAAIKPRHFSKGGYDDPDVRKSHRQFNENRSLVYQLERKGHEREKNKFRALWHLTRSYRQFHSDPDPKKSGWTFQTGSHPVLHHRFQTRMLRTLQEGLGGNIRLDAGELVHAKFRFKLQIDGKTRSVTFEITPPNVTNLHRSRYADIVGAYLKENGVKLV